MGPLPSVHQVVLLQVGELDEALLAQGALERALPAVHTQMDLSQVWDKRHQLPRTLPSGRIWDPGQISSHISMGPLFSIWGSSVPLLSITALRASLAFPQDTITLSAALQEGR